MRFTSASSPSSPRRSGRRLPLLAGALCVALLASGCASRTALDESARAAAQGGAAVTPANGAQQVSVTPLQKFLWVFSPYRPTIQQGNFISEEMLGQLKVGMTRDQVKFVLGTPLLTDLFHAERWDYPFRLAKGNGETLTSRVVVFFKDGKVDRFEGGNLPTEREYIALIAGPVGAVVKADSAPLQPAVAPAGSLPPPLQPTSGPAQPSTAPAAQ